MGLGSDLFSQENLINPFPAYRRLRDAGPVVKLHDIDVFAIGRFADVQNALRDSEKLISGEGVGFNDIFNAPRGVNVIQSDGYVHTRLRKTVMKPLTPAALKDVRPYLKNMMVGHVQMLRSSGSFEAMSQLASFLPLNAVAHLVGLPQHGREHMLEWAAAAFNGIKPQPAKSDVQLLGEAAAFIGSMSRNKAAKGSWAEGLFKAASEGKISEQEALAAMSAYVLPSLDTTILASGHLLYNLARHPEQWEMLLKQPDMIPAAVYETMRHSSPVRWFSRVAKNPYAINGNIIPEGARVMLLYGCANRDERHYVEPDRFDITRNPRDHLGWGTGPHMCAGMHLARMEMEVLLEVLVEAEVSLNAGNPTYTANAGLFGFTELPFALN